MIENGSAARVDAQSPSPSSYNCIVISKSIGCTLLPPSTSSSCNLPRRPSAHQRHLMPTAEKRLEIRREQCLICRATTANVMSFVDGRTSKNDMRRRSSAAMLTGIYPVCMTLYCIMHAFCKSDEPSEAEPRRFRGGRDVRFCDRPR